MSSLGDVSILDIYGGRMVICPKCGDLQVMKKGKWTRCMGCDREQQQLRRAGSLVNDLAATTIKELLDAG